MSGLMLSNSSSEQCRILKDHQLQTTRPLRRLTETTWPMIHRNYTAVLSTLQEKKCTLTNAYRLAGTARSTISDFLGVAELKIVNEVTFESTLERLGNPKLAVKTIEQECRKQLGGLLPVVKRLSLTRKLLPLAQDNAFHS